MFLRLTAVLLLAANVQADVVISQVYGGGGNSNATYLHDFIEVFNRGTTSVNLTGWSVQYASFDGTTWQTTPLSGSLAPGQYLLVREGTGQSGDGAPLPAPDVTASIAMAADKGKVALVHSTATLSGGCPSTDDFVGYGGANCSEGSPAPLLSNQTAALRDDSGCTDTGSNAGDFSAGAPGPRNKSSPLNPCSVPDAPPSIAAPGPLTVPQDEPPFSVMLTGTDDHNAFAWSVSEGSGVQDVSLTSGQGTATVSFTVTLVPGFSGTAMFPAMLSDGVNPVVSRVVNITVVPASPPPLPHVVVSQIYGSGGSSGALFRNDYVELFNPTSTGVDLNGWTLQYASATGTSWQTQALAGTIGPGEYYLIALASGGSGGSVLPPANVEGGFNMSATAGKVALVNGDDPRDGCPVGESGVIDLVGYGSAATCREGATNAPAGGATMAIFRKDSGATDTNVNGADFETGIANPRRTAPIAERGPTVRRVDPFSGLSNAPRDASPTVTFSEAVEMTGSAWFGIQCVVTGTHAVEDATVGRSDDARTWIITPNASFKSGEQCTVTIFGSLVRDVDVDDAPGNDTLPGNYTWKFAIATGAEPPYPPEVHLAMGNPSSAAEEPDNFLMRKPEYSLSYNRSRGIANWVSWHLEDSWTGTLARNDTFRPDPAVRPEWYRVLPTDYTASGFDRGHMVPNADRNKETSVPINQATYLMSNMVPQAPDNNQGPWVKFENHLRTLLPANELYIVAGGAGTGGVGDNGLVSSLADGAVTVPARTWKVALVLPKGGDDLARVDAATKTIAVDMPNVQGIRSDDWTKYLTTVDHVEAMTGYDFFTNIGDAVESAIEAGTNGVNPPGVANQTLSTNEDTPLPFALNAASTGTPTVSFTGPSHGVLTGSGLSRTYTPAPDYHGADSFTFRVSNGNGSSAVATATITVAAVNDPPVAGDDSRNVFRNATLQFPASELTANDASGPADESGPLVVASVASTAETHGTVILVGGVVTYAPAAGFSGTASFIYTVCDTGSLCAAGHVNVTVLAQSKRRAVRNAGF